MNWAPITLISGVPYISLDPHSKRYLSELRGGNLIYHDLQAHHDMIACMKNGLVQNQPLPNVKIDWPQAFFDEDDLIEAFDAMLAGTGFSLIKKKVCECGKDKHGFACHSTWCPKFSPV